MTDSHPTLVVDGDELPTTVAAGTMTPGGLPGSFTWPDGRTPNLRRIIADMIEEYAPA
ncbi:hypothetical protein [Amycolatopsis sp. NPDC098790]|uniref:hypothetical protein n=1 Tax=Amycolatopsis sp. NPDC098790 TaxID=3363939 RepID=UPI003809AEDD